MYFVAVEKYSILLGCDFFVIVSSYCRQLATFYTVCFYHAKQRVVICLLLTRSIDDVLLDKVQFPAFFVPHRMPFPLPFQDCLDLKICIPHDTGCYV